MFQPVTLTWGLLCLLTVTAAEAQPPLARNRRVVGFTGPDRFRVREGRSTAEASVLSNERLHFSGVKHLTAVAHGGP